MLSTPLTQGQVAPGHLAGLRRRIALERAPRGMGRAIALSLLPGTLLFATFYLIPLGILIATSFAQWSAFSLQYTGTANYGRLIHDAVFWKAVQHTVFYAAAAIVVQIPLAVTVALILSQRIRGWRIFRAILFTPVVISGAAYALVFASVYNASYGLLNRAFALVGLDGHDWLFDLNTALLAVIGTYVFNVGLYMILVMTEISSIPLDILEAAEVDGASRLQRQLHIVLPLLRHVIGTCILLSLLSTLAFFDIVYILTSGGPADATVTLTVYAFREYLSDQWGYANTIGIFIVVAGFLVIVTIRRLFRVGEREL